MSDDSKPVPAMDRMQESIDHWRLRAEKAEAEAAMWKANHDNQVVQKRILSLRTDLPMHMHPERAKFVAALQAVEQDRDRLSRELADANPMRALQAAEFAALHRKLAIAVRALEAVAGCVGPNHCRHNYDYAIARRALDAIDPQ